MEDALNLGIEDVLVNEDHSVDVITAPEDFMTIKSGLIERGFHPKEADVLMRAETDIHITDSETAEKVINLIDSLEELDDVQSVYSNVDISEEIVKGLA
jgi:transcriptional/translational regulatory protein YebC/TACO1